MARRTSSVRLRTRSVRSAVQSSARPGTGRTAGGRPVVSSRGSRGTRTGGRGAGSVHGACLRIASLARSPDGSANGIGALGTRLGSRGFGGETVRVSENGAVVPEALNRAGLGSISVPRTRSGSGLGPASTGHRARSPCGISPSSGFSGTRPPRSGRPRIGDAG